MLESLNFIEWCIEREKDNLENHPELKKSFKENLEKNSDSVLQRIQLTLPGDIMFAVMDTGKHYISGDLDLLAKEILEALKRIPSKRKS